MATMNRRKGGVTMRPAPWKVGELARWTGVSVRTLHYYDEIGLLRPAHVDGSSGYRYYDPVQLGNALAIRRLRRLEVPLDEIRALLGADRETLRARLAEHRERVAASTEDKRRLLAEIDRFITREEELVPIEDMEIEVREVPELRLAALIRQVHIDEMNEALPRMIDTAAAWIGECGAAPVGPPVGVFRSGDREDWHLVEAGWPVEAEFEPDERLGVHVYPASKAAAYEHRGPYEELDPVAQRFIAAVGLRGLRYTQPIRIEYLTDPTRHPPADLRSRIVWPVE
jgi:DNA-binding transcriptional MerR regulator